MKYIKLFENFNESELIVKDIINCILDLDDNPKLLHNELDNKLFVFSVPGDYSKNTDRWESEFNTSKLRLEDEGYTLVTDKNDAYISDKVLIIETEYLNRYSFDEIALQYLEQFKGLKQDEAFSWPIYKDKDGKVILMVHEGIDAAMISKDVWYLLDLIFPVTEVDLVQSLGVNRRVEKILKDWIIENYGFTHIAKVAPN
jgi:hypothetical protein